MPLSRFPFRRTLFALAVTALFAPTLQAADKGRWINDGFGRSTRDGKGSSCVSSGGDTHAFANADCEGGETAAKRAPASGAAAPAAPTGSTGGAATGGAAKGAAPAVIIVEDPKATAPAATGTGHGAAVVPAATIRDTSGAPVRDGLARKCVLDARGLGLSGADCDGTSAVAEPMVAPAAASTAGAPATTAPAVAAPDAGASAAAPAAAASSAGAGTGVAAAAAAGAGAAVAAMAGDDDTPPEDDDADAALIEDDPADEDTEEDTPWLADGDGPDALADSGDADAAPAYAGEALWGESAAAEPPPSPATLRESDTAPVATAAAPSVATESARPAVPAVQPPLKKVLQVEKSALFDTNSAVLKQKSVPELDELAALLRDAPGYGAVTVVGHTDRLGSDKLNQRLSERRAKAVRDYLVTRGVDPSRITAEGRGRLQPVTAPGACDRLKRKALRACLAPDRRVEIEAQDIQVPASPAK